MAPCFTGAPLTVLLKLALSGIEAVTNSDINILIGLMFYHQLFTGHGDGDVHIVGFTLLLMMMGRINSHMAADNLVAEALQLFRPAADSLLGDIGEGEVVSGDLQRLLHRPPPVIPL